MKCCALIVIENITTKNKSLRWYKCQNGGTVDTLDSKPSAEGRESSSLSFGTIKKDTKCVARISGEV